MRASSHTVCPLSPSLVTLTCLTRDSPARHRMNKNHSSFYGSSPLPAPMRWNKLSSQGRLAIQSARQRPTPGPPWLGWAQVPAGMRPPA
eukprot:4017428-Pyramimonas_sp.AAC.1